MRSFCFLLPAFFSFLSSSAQFLYPVKEQSDYIVHKQLYDGTFVGLASYATDHVDSWSTYNYPEAVGQLQLGYLQLYRTTKDKAYIVKFMNIALRAMAWRRENLHFTDPSFLGSSLYKNGVLLWAWSDFIHLLSVEEPELAQVEISEDLLHVPSSTISGNTIPVAYRSTFGTVAQWLLGRSRETLETILATQWSDDQALGAGIIHGLNQEAVFGAAMLNLGHVASVTGDPTMMSYLDKGALMLRKFRYSSEDDRCACVLGLPVLLNNTNNSYFWYHDGWSHPRRPGYCPYVDCNGASGIAHQDLDLSDRHEFMEDISHGIYDMELPRLANLYNVYTGGSEPFTDIDMVKFRNTFTTQIAQPYQGSWGFCSGVYGCDALVGVYGGYGFNHYRRDAMAWMFLHEWDEAIGAEPGPGVYEILTAFYEAEVYPNPIDITSGFAYWGVAQVAAAQWERECFSLDLYNRELVYDQDFTAKKTLRVYPEGEAGASFADPVIHEPRFTVNDQVRATFRAGSTVIFEPGFEAVPGSVVEAVIDPMGCDLAYKSLAPPMAQRTEVEAMEERMHPSRAVVSSVATDGPLPPQPVDRLRMVPNPTTGRAFAFLELQAARTVSVVVHDATGREVWSNWFSTLSAGEHRLPLSVLLPAGIYHCTVLLDGSLLTERLVVE